MKTTLLAAALVAGTTTQSVLAASSADPEAIAEFVSTAEKLCGAYSANGSSSSLGASGNLDADLTLLKQKLLGLGVDGAAAITTEEFQNVLRSDLGEEIKDARRCREAVFNRLFEAAYGQAPTDEVLLDSQSALENSIVPDEVPIIASGQKYPIVASDTVAIGTSELLFTLNQIKMDTARNIPLIYYSWSDLMTGKFQTNVYVYMGTVAALGTCRAVPVSADVEAQKITLQVRCK